jgi:putative endopeptidase
MRLSLLFAVSAAALLTACNGEKPAAPAAEAPKAALGAFGIDTSAMDTSVKPGDDFYKYVNGKWTSTFQMPADKARYGVFDSLRDKSETDVKTLLEELAKTPPAAGSVQQKVVDLYNSWMDEAAIEARGTEPLKADLDAINAAKSKADLIKLMGNTDYAGPIGMYISPDPADPTKYVVNVTQAGLGMPVRDYYLNKGEKFDAYRAAYKAYVAKIFELIGDADPAKSADAVVALETKLATVHWSPEKQRDVQATNNPVDRAGLKKMIPAIDWDLMLPVSGLGEVQHFVVNETTALRDGAKLLDTQPVDAWKKYLAFHLASDYAASLPKTFDQANFDFYRKTLAGVEVQRDRWKRGVQLLDGLIGEGVGELYVAQFFPPDHKAKMDELVANLRAAMGERLKTLAWMDDATRAEAQKKLATFDPRVGYPVKWRNYSAYTVQPGKLFENVRRRPGRELWRHRRGDRPRDRPRLRRPGPRVRRGRQDPQLVDARDQREVQGRHRQVRRAVQHVLPAGRRLRERQLHHGREHRRPGRPRNGLRRLQALARRQGSACDRRLHRRPALLHGARASVARDPARRCPAQPAPHRPALARGRARLDPGAQHGRLVRRLQRPAHRQGLHRTGRAREDLVG